MLLGRGILVSLEAVIVVFEVRKLQQLVLWFEERLLLAGTVREVGLGLSSAQGQQVVVLLPVDSDGTVVEALEKVCSTAAAVVVVVVVAAAAAAVDMLGSDSLERNILAVAADTTGDIAAVGEDLENAGTTLDTAVEEGAADSDSATELAKGSFVVYVEVWKTPFDKT